MASKLIDIIKIYHEADIALNEMSLSQIVIEENNHEIHYIPENLTDMRCAIKTNVIHKYDIEAFKLNINLNQGTKKNDLV